MGLFGVAGPLLGQRLQAEEARVGSRPAENALVAEHIVRPRVEGGPVKTGRQPIYHLRRVAAQGRQQRFGLAEGGGQRIAVGQGRPQLAQRRQQRPAVRAVKLPLEGGLRFRRLGGAELRVDLKAVRGDEAGGQASRRQPLPVLQSAGVVVGVVGLQAAQQHFPLQERRSQADALERGASVVVTAGFRLLKGLKDAVEVGVQGFRQGRTARGLLLQGGIGGARQDFRRSVRRLGRQLQRLFDFAAPGQLFGDLSEPGRGGAVHRQGGVKDGEGVARLALAAELTGAAEVGLAKHVEVGGRRFGLVDLLGQVERLLKSPFADRFFRTAFHDWPGRRRRRAVFLLCQGDPLLPGRCSGSGMPGPAAPFTLLCYYTGRSGRGGFNIHSPDLAAWGACRLRWRSTGRRVRQAVQALQR